MKIIIIAGGRGTRISEETADKPKPMVLINGQPILWHLMNIFALQGFNDFIVSTGYKGEIIEDWVFNNKILDSNSNKMIISTVNTGIDTHTSGRISEIMKIHQGERVIATYGDGLANVSINKLIAFHAAHQRIATVTAVRPPARFGYLRIQNKKVTHFGEKNQTDAGWINGGFFVLEPGVLNYINSINEPFEMSPLSNLALNSELMAYEHNGFWQPMDTLREKKDLENFAVLKVPPWLNFN